MLNTFRNIQFQHTEIALDLHLHFRWDIYPVCSAPLDVHSSMQWYIFPECLLIEIILKKTNCSEVLSKEYILCEHVQLSLLARLKQSWLDFVTDKNEMFVKQRTLLQTIKGYWNVC